MLLHTLIQLVDAAYNNNDNNNNKKDREAFIAHLKDNYNANNNKNIRAPKGYTSVWPAPLLFLGFGGGGGVGEEENISWIIDRSLIDDCSESEVSLVSVGVVDRTWS